jgi:hypothetical protein
MLQRSLRPGEVVHHRNNDPLDNRPENLEPLRDQGEHINLHRPELEAARGLRKEVMP